MEVIKNIILLLKRIVNKEENIKMLEISTQKEKFIKSIKVSPVEEEKRKVETLVCSGDGLGIQTGVEY